MLALVRRAPRCRCRVRALPPAVAVGSWMRLTLRPCQSSRVASASQAAVNFPPTTIFMRHPLAGAARAINPTGSARVCRCAPAGNRRQHARGQGAVEQCRVEVPVGGHQRGGGEGAADGVRHMQQPFHVLIGHSTHMDPFPISTYISRENVDHQWPRTLVMPSANTSCRQGTRVSCH